MPERRPAAKRPSRTARPQREAPRASRAATAADPGRPAAATERELDAGFNALVRGACLKAGAAGAVNALTTRVPMLERLVPGLLQPALVSMLAPAPRGGGRRDR